jgi:hypothetical protein
MDNYTAIGIAEGFVEPETEQQVIEAWQHLIDTGLAWKMQGWFGRTAIQLIEMGIVIVPLMDNSLKIGDLVMLKDCTWNYLGVITLVDMSHLGIDTAFVEVLWLGHPHRHLERATNLEVINGKGRLSESK